MAIQIYLVKDLARLSGLSVYTVKHYLAFGLIKEIGRTPETKFRYFDDSTLEKLEKVKNFRKQRISLNKIREIMSLKEV